MTQRALAVRLGKPSATVSAWELGKAMPASTNLVALVRIFGTTVDRLLTDAGIQQRRPDGRDGADAHPGGRRGVQPRLPCFDLGRFVADRRGRPLGTSQFQIPRSPDNDDPHSYGLRITGNALYPRFWDGDVVEVVTNARLQDGDLVVMLHRDGRCWIRRVSVQPGRGGPRYDALNPSDERLDVPLSAVHLHKVICVKPKGTYGSDIRPR